MRPLSATVQFFRVSWIVFVVVLVLLPTVGRATWPQDGVAIVTAANNQSAPKVISDGAGGAIIVWDDNRAGPSNIYVQRVNALGVPQWTPGGVAVTASNNDNAAQIIADGAGGAIITWFHNQDIFAQRITSSGASFWTAGGVGVCTNAANQNVPAIASDNAGGAIITWQDFRNGADWDIYARRITALGAVQWTADGVAVCALAGQQPAPRITADGSGGAVIVWNDNRGGAVSDIYVQRVNSAGATQWTANGVAVCTAADSQQWLSIVPDGSGGAIVVWEDYRVLQWDVYAMRVNSAGTPQWAANGVAVVALPNHQRFPALLSDGLGGAIIAWGDYRAGLDPELYAQRLNGAGTAQWAANGVALTTAGSANEPSMVSDGLGGAIIAWLDARSGSLDLNIYARRINGSGVPQWMANGTALCTAPGTQRIPMLASDGVSGAIVAWQDERAAPGARDVYAQRIERNGQWGYPSPNIIKARDVPGDQGGQVNLAWDASRLDPWPDELIDNYTVWRALDPTTATSLMLAGEDIRVQEIDATTYYWQLIHTLGAYGLTGYSDIVPTPFDSTASSNEPIYFQVIAHAGSGQWISEPASGRSVDNVAPQAPLQLTAQRVGADVHLVWNRNHEIDFDHYSVYRGTSAGVTPVPSFFLESTDDTVLVDENVPGTAPYENAPATGLYYIVTAVDIHNNQSSASNEVIGSPVTGVGDAPRSYVLSVSNYPNPFNPRTTVSYTVPSRGEVKISIYDVRGALVATLFNGDRSAGAYTIEWDGRSQSGTPVGTGVYLARIEHASGTRSKKMVLLK